MQLIHMYFLSFFYYIEKVCYNVSIGAINDSKWGNTMEHVKKILLLTSASNFEAQKKVIHAIDKKLKEIGGYALFVFSSYGLYREKDVYEEGEASIYRLLDEESFDGCIMDSNIGNRSMYHDFVRRLQGKGTPSVTVNFGLKGIPFVSLDCYDAGCQLMEHLITVHHCSKINMVAMNDNDVNSNQLLKAYRDTLLKYGIPMEEKRMIEIPITVQHGRDLFHIFRERGIDDAEAVICNHDVLCIGLCLEMEEQGYKVPDDLIICSLNRSANSFVFRPDIAGADRKYEMLAEKACEVLVQLIDGKEVPQENYCKGKIYFGQSCGCEKEKEDSFANQYQDIILAKIEAGNQISRMMQYNDSLEGVNSLDELGDNIRNMLWGISCKEFIFCLNQRTLEYITSAEEYTDCEEGRPFDEKMIAVIGTTNRTGELKNYKFSLTQLLPMGVKEGDMILFLPIHHKERVYGYLAFINEYLPVDLYNYRICHESIGSSMENLHRQMLLRKSIDELDNMHMKDALTDLQNRYAWNRYQQQYIVDNEYCVVMIDMDGLKKINDGFGHLAGNNAICITAKAIKTSMDERDLVTRFGGDEFQILSLNTDAEYWENMKSVLNKKIKAYAARQKLPFEVGVSLGYCICSRQKPISFEECCETADQLMYEDKRARKKCRNS